MTKDPQLTTHDFAQTTKDSRPTTIYLGTDHAGYELKEHIKSFLLDQNYEVIDLCEHALVEGDDYPLHVREVGKKVSEENNTRGIIFGESGQGEAITVNRIIGVRAVVYYGENQSEIIKLSRLHNDANILSIGARFVLLDEAEEMIKLWLETDFSGDERHIRRIEQIDS